MNIVEYYNLIHDLQNVQKSIPFYQGKNFSY